MQAKALLAMGFLGLIAGVAMGLDGHAAGAALAGASFLFTVVYFVHHERLLEDRNSRLLSLQHEKAHAVMHAESLEKRLVQLETRINELTFTR